jgi:hypothetical protein
MFLKGLGHEIDFKKLFFKFEVYATRFKFSEAPCNLSKTKLGTSRKSPSL